MKTTKKWLAFLLSFAMIITFIPATERANANETNTITVTLRVEDANGTLIPSTKVELTENDVTAINDAYTSTTVVETGSIENGTYETSSIEQPLFTTTGFTAAHALAKCISTDFDSLATDLTFSWGNPSYIKGEETLDYYPSWSYRVNNASPTDATTGYSYNSVGCPIQDGDTIVFFRQGCYDPNAGAWGAYTNYSWFDQNTYEATTNTSFSVSYQRDDGFGMTTSAVAGEPLLVYDANQKLIQTTTTSKDGIASILIKEAGSYTLVAEKATNGIPELSRAFAQITVTPASIATATPAATVAPSSTPAATVTPTTESGKKSTLATPKKVTAKGKKNKVTVSWKKVKKATGYEVVITGKKVKKIKKTTKKTSFTKKLKKGRYTIKVRCYKKQKNAKLYSKYSKIIKVTVK